MATLHLEIVTPEGSTFSGEADMVVLPGSEGELGIYPNHIPLMTKIVPGELVVHNKGTQSALAVGEGFVEITQTSISILTDMAIHEEDIDESEAEAAIERAKKLMEDSEHQSQEEMAAVQAALLKATARLNIKRRRRSS